MNRQTLRQTYRRWRTLWTRASLATVLLLGTLAPLSASAAGPAETPRVLPQLLREATQSPEKSFRVVVARGSKDNAAERGLASKGYQKIKDAGSAAFVADVKGKHVAELGRLSAVRWISLDAPMRPTGTVDASKIATVYNQTLNTPQLWASGITGKGVSVAVVDTGIDGGEPDFWTSRVVKSVYFAKVSSGQNDVHGHGTHVAGIVGGNSWPHYDPTVKGKYIGVAPEVNLVSLAVADDQGMSYLSDVVNAIEWAIANRQTYNIRVLNLSLLSSVAESHRTSILSAAVERAWFSGIFVVVSAGNLGADSAYFPPANDPFVVTVGASDARGTGTRSDDGMAPWSSYGTTQDGFAKPDVVAPGRQIVSVLSDKKSTYATRFGDRIVESSYIRLSGSSMSAPMVAGIAALAFQSNPQLTNDALKWLLMNTATPLGGAAPLAGQGAGLVDAAAVVTHSGAPSVANQGVTISSHLVGPNGATSYTNSAWATSAWATSAWATSAWATSAWATSAWATGTPQIAPWTHSDVD